MVVASRRWGLIICVRDFKFEIGDVIPVGIANWDKWINISKEVYMFYYPARSFIVYIKFEIYMPPIFQPKQTPKFLSPKHHLYIARDSIQHTNLINFSSLLYNIYATNISTKITYFHNLGIHCVHIFLSYEGKLIC